MKIEKADLGRASACQYRCLNDDGMLCGLITQQPTGGWRVELFMRVEAQAETKDEAIAFAKGCWAMAEQFTNLVTKAVPKVPHVLDRSRHAGA